MASRPPAAARPNRAARRRQISTVAQRPDAGQRYAADMKVATRLHKEGKLDQAITLYRKITKVYEDLPEVRVAWSNMGAALQGQDKLEDAVKALKKARSMDSSAPPTHHNLGMALVGLGRVEEGLDSLTKAIELQPRFRDAWIGFLKACDATGQMARAEDLCRTLLAADSVCLPALVALGDVLRRQGRFAEAEDQYTQALTVEPNAVEAHISLGLLRLATGEALRAAEGLLDVARKMPQVGPLRSALLEALVQLKGADPVKAEELALAWRDSVPGDQQVAKVVDGLRRPAA